MWLISAFLEDHKKEKKSFTRVWGTESFTLSVMMVGGVGVFFNFLYNLVLMGHCCPTRDFVSTRNFGYSVRCSYSCSILEAFLYPPGHYSHKISQLSFVILFSWSGLNAFSKISIYSLFFVVVWFRDRLIQMIFLTPPLNHWVDYLNSILNITL